MASDGFTRRATLGALAAPALLSNDRGGLSPGQDASGRDAAPLDNRIAALRAAGRAGRAVINPDHHAPDKAMRVTGEFADGLQLDGANSIITPSAAGVDGMFAGNVVGSVAREYYNKFRFSNFVLVGKSKKAESAGLRVEAGADMVFTNYRIRNFKYGIYLYGGLSNSFVNITARDNMIGLRATYYIGGNGKVTGSFNSNANSFFGLKLFSNEIAIDYDNTPNTAINFFGGNIEANNYTTGNNHDGKKAASFTAAGHINMFGIHSESNKGQYGYFYSGKDSSKVFLLTGCEIVDDVGTNVYIDKGTLCSIGSRITNHKAEAYAYFNTGSYGTLIDSDTVPSGDLSHVVSLRFGRLTFGANSNPGNAPIYITPAAIAGSARNIAMLLRNDTVQIQFQNTAGARVGYIQTTATADHVLSNTSSGGGWAIQAANITRLWVGRRGAASIEPGADNGVKLGSAIFRFSTVYAGTGAIATSDAREKQQVRELSDAERAIAVRCKGLLRAFKFNDAVKEKGDGARIHFGVIAQDVIEAFAAEGLDAAKYALLCHDRWDDQIDSWCDEHETVSAVYSDSEKDEDGSPKLIQPEKRVLVRAAGSKVIHRAGDRYGVRYEELLAFIIAAL